MQRNLKKGGDYQPTTQGENKKRKSGLTRKSDQPPKKKIRKKSISLGKRVSEREANAKRLLITLIEKKEVREKKEKRT